MSLSMIICGDTVPTKDNFKEFAEGNREALVCAPLWNEMKDADFRFFNLEVPLCRAERPILKAGPNLIAPPETVKGLTAMGADLVGLANNHTLDQADEGLFETFDALRSESIPYIGAGKNLADATKPYIFGKKGKKVGVYNCAEHEFTIAEEDAPGANPFDVFDSLEHIRTLKTKCDYVVVIYHGCKEHYRYPSPKVQKACRKMVEAGADLVVGQHSHCIGCEERYRDGVIVYGQGNFVFKLRNDEFWNTSIVIRATFGDKMEVKYIPVVQSEKGVTLGTQEILDDFFTRSAEIKTPGFIQKTYEKFSFSMLGPYCTLLSSFLDTVKKENLIEKLATEENVKCHSSAVAVIENLLQCEAHNEMLLTALHAITDSGKYHK